MTETNSILTKITSVPQAGTRSTTPLSLRQQSDKLPLLSDQVSHKKRNVLSKNVSQEEPIAAKLNLTVAPVPANLSLDVDLHYIHLGKWHAGIQLTWSQAYRAIELCGSSCDQNVIWSAIEAVIRGGIA